MLTPDHIGRYMGKGHWDMWMYTWRHWVWRGMDRMRCRLWGPIWKTKREKQVKKGIGIDRGPLNNGSKSHICLNATFQRLVSFSRNFFCRNFSPVLLVEFIWGEEVLFAGAAQAPKFYTREAKQQFWREILSMSRVLKLNNDWIVSLSTS